jgi:hypothetical protein
LWNPPGSAPQYEELLAEYMKALPEYPMPIEAYKAPVGGPAVDVPSELA